MRLIQGAIGRVQPKVTQKGWTRGTPPSTRAAAGVLNAKESFISYTYNRGRVEQGYMKSHPDRVGIGTVLCYEGLSHARQQGAIAAGRPARFEIRQGNS